MVHHRAPLTLLLTEAELASCINDKVRLQGIVALQEQQSIDVVKINAKRTSLEEALASTNSAKERIDASNYEDEVRLSRKMADIDR